PAPDWLGVGPAAGYGAGAGGVGGAGDLGGPGDLGGYRGGGGLAGTGGPIVPAGRRRMLTLVGVAAAVIGLVIAGGIYLYVQKASAAHAAGEKQGKTASPVPKVPEHVVSITPAEGSTSVNGAADIRVEFSAP